MPPRIFKRKSIGKYNRNFELNPEESRIEDAGLSRNMGANLPTSKRENTMQEGSPIPNRVFVGGIPVSVNEGDLRSRFVNYGNVKAVKIVRDHLGISKGYGFVTYNTEDEAKRALEKAEVIFKGRKLNIAPAVKKQNSRSECSEYFWNSSDSSIAEQETSKKNPMMYSQTSGKEIILNAVHNHYPGFIRYEVATNGFENHGPYIQGWSYGTTDFQNGYGSLQMNILPYPTLVYLPQNAFQYPGTVSYPISGAFQEIIPILPAPLGCINESRKRTMKKIAVKEWARVQQRVGDQ